MRIVHIAPNSVFMEGWGYQENLLPKYQKLSGNDVVLIVRDVCRDKTGHNDDETQSQDFVSKSGFRVIRRKVKKCVFRKLTELFSSIDVYDVLCDLKPDYVHFHGLVSNTINQVVKYKKKKSPEMIIVMDNHNDRNNSSLHENGLKSFFRRMYYRWLFKKNERYISVVYGVTPGRRQYLIDVFGVPEQKTKLMIMGADDQKFNFKQRSIIRDKVRTKYKIGENDFLIVTGGKINKEKKIDLLMRACCGLENVKLLIFGNVEKDVSVIFDELLTRSENIIYTGWATLAEQYDFYFAADLVVFPGLHSVMWEQACASKTPCLFGIKEGMEHLDNGGNSDFIDDVSDSGIREKIEKLKYTEQYWQMKKNAESESTGIYLYSHIAAQSLEDAKNLMIAYGWTK